MASKNGYKFTPHEMQKIKELIGNPEKIKFFFLAYGDVLRSPNGKHH